MPETRSSRGQALMYVGFVFLFSSVFYFLLLRAHSLTGGGGRTQRGSCGAQHWLHSPH